MRASDADRDRVATLLSHAYAEGRITHEEHDERLQAAMTARTFDDLLPLTSDLVPLDRPLPAPASSTSPRLPAIDRAGATHESDTITAVFGDTTRRDTWRVRAHTSVTMLFAEANLDMREAIFDDTEVDLGGFLAFSEIKILVPEGVNVRDETATILGETTIKGLDPHPDGPVLTLRGTICLGSISVRGPRAKPWYKFRSRSRP